jgi:hypothetical protein
MQDLAPGSSSPSAKHQDLSNRDLVRWPTIDTASTSEYLELDILADNSMQQILITQI